MAPWFENSAVTNCFPVRNACFVPTSFIAIFLAVQPAFDAAKSLNRAAGVDGIILALA